MHKKLAAVFKTFDKVLVSRNNFRHRVAGNWEVEPMVKAMSLRRSEIPRGHDLGRLRDVAVTFTWKKPLCSDNPRYLEVATSDYPDDFHMVKAITLTGSRVRRGRDLGRPREVAMTLTW